jgi:putative flippase GtrA
LSGSETPQDSNLVAVTARVRAKAVFVELRRLVRFGAIGITALVVYSSLYATLAETTHLSAIPISIIAYATGMVVSFVGHKYFTFGVAGNIRAQIFKFVAWHSLCLFVTVLITGLVVDKFSWPYGIGILIVDVAIPLLSFLALKLVVFKDKSSPSLLSEMPASDGYRQ